MSGTADALEGAKEKSETTLVGPTDPVTNRAVTQESLARSKMFEMLKSVSEYQEVRMRLMEGSRRE